MWVNARNAGEATAREYVATPVEAVRCYVGEFPECMEFDVRIIG